MPILCVWGAVRAGAIEKKGPRGKGQVDSTAAQIDHVSELPTWTLDLGQQSLMEQTLGTRDKEE